MKFVPIVESNQFSNFVSRNLEILCQFKYFVSESHIYLFNELRNTYISIKNIFDFFKFVQVCNFKWKTFHTMNVEMQQYLHQKIYIQKIFMFLLANLQNSSIDFNGLLKRLILENFILLLKKIFRINILWNKIKTNEMVNIIRFKINETRWLCCKTLLVMLLLYHLNNIICM